MVIIHEPYDSEDFSKFNPVFGWASVGVREILTALRQKGSSVTLAFSLNKGSPAILILHE